MVAYRTLRKSRLDFLSPTKRVGGTIPPGGSRATPTRPLRSGRRRHLHLRVTASPNSPRPSKAKETGSGTTVSLTP